MTAHPHRANETQLPALGPPCRQRPAAPGGAYAAPPGRTVSTGARLAIEDHAHSISREVGFLLAAERMPSPIGRWATQRYRIGELTTRECEVFLLLGEGLNNRKISLRLGVGERTVKLHVTSILRKLGLESRLQAGLAAAEHALLAHFPKVQ